MGFDPDNVFQIVPPEQAGIPSSALCRILETISREGTDLHSLLIWRQGKLICEQYFAPYEADTQHMLCSCSKTFVSMLIGIAQEKGLLSIGDKISDYFADVPVECSSEYFREMTLRDLLMMGTGHSKNTFSAMNSAKDGDWVEAFFSQPVTYKPGTHFVYNSGATYMLSTLLTRLTGKTALELAEEWIFRLIGIENAQWDTCPRGISKGGVGLHLKPRDMLRFGILLLSGGRWGDKQIIPADYLREAQQAQISNRNPSDPNQNPNWAAGYGYQMWRCAFDAFRADGMGGQFIVVLPAYHTVVVTTGGICHDIGLPLRLISEILLPSMQQAPMKINQEEFRKYTETGKKLAYSQPAPLPSDANAFPYGTVWKIPENPMGFSSVAIWNDRACLELTGCKLNIRFCWNAPFVNRDPISSSAIIAEDPAVFPRYNVPFALYRIPEENRVRIVHAPVSAMARWADNAFYLRINFYGEPFTMHLTLAPKERTQMHLHVRSSWAEDLDLDLTPDDP